MSPVTSQLAMVGLKPLSSASTATLRVPPRFGVPLPIPAVDEPVLPPPPPPDPVPEPDAPHAASRPPPLPSSAAPAAAAPPRARNPRLPYELAMTAAFPAVGRQVLPAPRPAAF